jgi:hypothetical protein
MKSGIFFLGHAVVASILVQTAAAQPAQSNFVDFNNNRNFATVADRDVYNVDGTPLLGTQYLAQLYYGPDVSNLQPVANAPARFRDPANVPAGSSLAGTWVGGSRVLAGFAEGQTVTLEVRVWDSTTGATYETAAVHMQSASFSYTIPFRGAAPAAYYMENFRGIRPLTPPIPAALTISETNGTIQVGYGQITGGALEVSDDLVTWTATATQGSPYTDATAGNVTRRFYRVKASGLISRNYVGFYRVNFAPGFTFFANQLRPADDRVVALLSDPPSETTVFAFSPSSASTAITYYVPSGWEGDDVMMRLSPGSGAIIYSPTAFTRTFVGEVVLNSTNELAAGLSLVGSAVPKSLPLTGAGGLGLPIAAGDEIYQFSPAIGGYVVNTFMGNGWEGDDGGDTPVVAVGECFWIRKAAPATWVQRINQYSPPP